LRNGLFGYLEASILPVWRFFLRFTSAIVASKYLTLRSSTVHVLYVTLDALELVISRCMGKTAIVLLLHFLCLHFVKKSTQKLDHPRDKVALLAS